MKLSIVIRCRNEAKSLRHVFDALKAQRCSFEWEIVVVDNESEDNTREVCREYGARVVSLPRGEFTYGRATNVGISDARGELILLISAHAIPIGSYFLESAVAPFSDPDMAAARCLWLGSAKDVIGRWHQPKDIQYKSREEQQMAESGTKWLGEYPTAGCCVLRRSVWEQVKYDETLEANEDKCWASQVLARGYKMRSCSEAMWVYMRTYSPRDRWRKDNREQLAFYRMTGRAPMSWPKFFSESARALLTAPSIAFRYAVGKIVWNAHLVTIPWQARRKAQTGELAGIRASPRVRPPAINKMKHDLDQILATLDARPSAAAYMQAARELSSIREQLVPVRVALLASFTIDSIAPFLTVEAARLGFAAELYVAPFNSVKQELLGADSGCVRHKPDVVFVANLLGDVCPALTHDVLPSQIDPQIEALLADTIAPLQEFRKHATSAIVLHSFARPRHAALGIYEAMASGSQTEAINQVNARLTKAISGIPGAYVLDLERVCANVGYDNCFDDKMWYLGRSPFSVPAWRALAREQVTFIRALHALQRKCLVLDLDNVLWGGVLGESGLANIKLGQTYAGSVFRDFQQTILELRNRGVLLAINSKNNVAEVEEAFRSHPDMLLKLEHFACLKINWQDKPQNMREIASELNIGLESLVFFDDNPAEQALMRQALPEVMTLPVPPEPIKYMNVLRESRAFDRLSLTDEDRRRGEMYQKQAARRQLQQSATSLQDFLTGLQMTVSINRVDDYAFPRVVDLLQKTNQFNLTTRRHSAGQLKAMIDDTAQGVFCLRVADRFGDNGIVGAAIVQRRDETAHIESFLLSCRVIGRTVETAFLSFLVDWAKDWGLTALEGEFVLTAKNAPAADFYAKHGFAQVGRTDSGSRWVLDLKKVSFQWPAYIERTGQTVTEK